MNNPQHHRNDIELMLCELAARERRSVRMDDAMAARLEARLEARFRYLSHRGYTRRQACAAVAAILLALGCLTMLNLPQAQKTATSSAAVLPAARQTISAAEWDRHFSPASSEREIVTRNGVEYMVETEEELPFTIDDCYL